MHKSSITELGFEVFSHFPSTYAFYAFFSSLNPFPFFFFLLEPSFTSTIKCNLAKAYRTFATSVVLRTVVTPERRGLSIV